MTRTTLLVLVAAALGGCGGGKDEESAVTPLVSVGVDTLRADSIADQVSIVGRLLPRPGGSALLSAPAAGFVRLVAVHLGQRVGAGDLLVALEVPDLSARARTLRGTANIARREADRKKELLAEGIASQREADEALAAAAAAEAEAEAAEQALARTEVRSPLAGAVQRLQVQPGERVAEGALLAEVVNADQVDFVGSVPAAQLSRIRQGAVASILVDGLESATTGRVLALTPAIDSVSNAGQVVVRVPNPEGLLRPGAGATVIITLGMRRNATVVPDSAIVVSGNSLAVFVVQPDSTVSERRVTLGATGGGRSQVIGALAPGEVIVTSGAYGLQDGMRVIPRAHTSP